MDTINNDCPLVMVSWMDSAQPVSSWSYLESFKPRRPILCASVGWLIQDDKENKAIAPNMGDIGAKGSMQVSGVIRIPACCIVKIKNLEAPVNSSSLSSRPEKEQTPPIT